MDPGSFLKGFSRETTIRRDAEGRWFHDGEPLEHANLTRAFDRWVDRAEDGRYCLKNDINWAYIELQGAPLFVRRLELGPGSAIGLVLSDDQKLPLAPETLREGPDGALYCDVPRGAGALTARFDRHAMQQLEDLLREDDAGVYLALGADKVRPPRVADPLASVLAGSPAS